MNPAPCTRCLRPMKLPKRTVECSKAARRAAALAFNASHPEERPLCTACGLRHAEAHFATGYYKHCAPCRVRFAAARERRRGMEVKQYKCTVCRTSLSSGRHSRGFCSRECRNRYHRELRIQQRNEVFGRLG